MRIHRLIGAAMVSTLGLAMAAPAAHAATTPAVAQPEVFVGSAAANALGLSLNGQTVTLGTGTAKVASNLLSSASGSAVMTVLGSTNSSAELKGVSAGSVTDGPKCNPKIDLSLVVIANACTTSTSTINAGQAHAVNTDTVEGININLNTVLSQTPLPQVLANTLQPIVNQLGNTTQLSPVTNTVGGVLSDILQTPTSKLTLGNSVSDVVTTPSSVVSLAKAQGGQLDILPAPVALNKAIAPLASVIIGSSDVTATYDRATGKSVSSFDPALVTVKLGQTPATPATVISLKPGTTQTITLPASLGSILIQVADGDTFTRPDGTVGAEANAVKLAVTLLNQPVINLAIAGATATVAGSPAVAAPLAPPTPASQGAPAVLPHTGGTPWIPLAGGVMLAAFLVVRRFRLSVV